MVLSPLFIQYTFPATRSKSRPMGLVTLERTISWFVPSIVDRYTIPCVESVQYTRFSKGSKATPVGLSIFENGKGTRMFCDSSEKYTVSCSASATNITSPTVPADDNLKITMLKKVFRYVHSHHAIKSKANKIIGGYIWWQYIQFSHFCRVCVALIVLATAFLMAWYKIHVVMKRSWDTS